MSRSPTLDSTLRDAHRRRIAAQLPTLGLLVSGCACSWFAVAVFADPMPFGRALAILGFQGLVFGVAAVLCRRDPAGPRVMPLAVGACVIVGLVWIFVFTTTATVAAALMFATLSLLAAAPIVLAWGLGPQLIFQGSLTLIWMVALVTLPKRLPIPELVATLGFSNLFALLAAQWAARGLRAEVRARVATLDFERQLAASRNAYRALAENALDFIWATDLEGRWTYVNEALARRCGLAVSDMIGRPVSEVLTDHPRNADPAALIARLIAGETIERQLLQMTTPEGPCWVEAVPTLVRDQGGAIVGVQGVSRDVTERHLAEERLRASEERFRSVFSNAPVGITVVTPDRVIVQVNRAIQEMLGYSEAELLGKRAPEVVHPDDVPVVRRLTESALAGQRQSFSVECRQVHRDGRTLWTQVHTYLERGSDGQPRRFISQIADITEQRAAEAALRASEHRFRTFAESMSAGVLIAQSQGIRYVNEAVPVITGYDRSELLRMQLADLVHPEERAAAERNTAARLAEKRVEPRVEYRVATKSGKTRWMDITATTIELDGEPTILVTAFDVTERKLVEHALRASEARYRGLVESQREIVVRFDADGYVTFANDAYCETYGVRHEDAIGRDFWPLVHPDDVEPLRIAVAATMLPPYRATVETRSRTVRGWCWFEWEASAIRDEQGTVVEGQAVGRDVTERRRAQEALWTSLEDLRRSEEKLRLLAQRQVAIREEERKRLSFDLHDDVCQELVGIGILVQSALARLGPVPPQAAGDLTRAAGYLNEVVEHLRLLARDLRPMVLYDLGLEGSLRSLSAGLSSAETVVRAVFATPIPRLDETTEVAVYRIAQEALTNAVRHAHARQVTVTLAAHQDRLALEVRDDGCGFDVAQCAGHAFGLTSMEERAQALAGRLTLSSRAGEGTTVRLECPMVERTPATTAA